MDHFPGGAPKRRLTRWLDQFKDCFGHRAQHVSLRQYVDGLLGDSARKSMSAMLARVSEPTSYQAFQHFITHAPWDAERMWHRLRAVVPERTGILILDETSFPKSGPHSVGAARQYCGALGKVAQCQVAVTAALWTGRRAWPLGALLYLPEGWASDAARRRVARIPPAIVFQEKWRLALTLVRRSQAAGLTLTAVVADAEYGDNRTVRQTLHRLRLPYAVGISPTLTVFRGTPTLRIDRQQPPPRNRRAGWPDQDAVGVRTLSDALPAPGLAPGAVAQWHQPALGSGLRRRAGDPGHRLATSAARTRSLAALRAGPRPDGAPQALSGVGARLGGAGAARAAGAPALGDRATLPGLQDRTRARSFRRALVSGLAAPHGHQRPRLRVSPDRTEAAPCGTIVHVSPSPGVRTRDLYRGAFRRSMQHDP